MRTLVHKGIAASILLAASAHAQPPAPGTPEALRTRNVAVIVHEGVELLDFAGPGEVFAAGARRYNPAGNPWFRVYTVAPSEGPIVSQGFVTVTPRYTIENCPRPDIVVIPGGDTGVLRGDAAFMAWIGRVVPETEVTLSVCTGAFVLADARFLDGQTATTHWGSVDGLREAARGATVRDDVRFVDAGRIVTTAGVSAGIDGSLHVVARLLGRAAADETARYMQYEWRPGAEDAARYSRLNPQLTLEQQEGQRAEQLVRAGNYEEAAAAFRAVVTKRPDEAAAWHRLGYCLQSLGRLEEALEANRRAASFTGNARVHRLGLYNEACVLVQMGRKDEALEALGKAIEAGMGPRSFIEQDADLASLREDARFRGMMEKMAR